MSATQSRISFPVKKRSSIAASKSNSKTKSKILSEKIDNVKDREPVFISLLSSDSEINSPSPVKTKTPKKKANDFINNDVTPPKQRRCSQIDVDDIENIINISPKTPSSLLAKLELNSPPPKKENKFTPKKLFAGKNEKNERYQNARQALHSCVPTEMPGRQKELEELQSFINSHLKNETSGTLYISGPPGTGKTASLTKIMSELQTESEYKEIYINCTSIKSAQAVYSKIAKELGLKTTGKTEKIYLTAIEKYLTTKHKTIILVLDEIDQLDSRKQSVLYTIFEWPAKQNSRMILIGIANALDLTDRILPRLQARCELKPKLMHFAPYNKQQIVEILAERLKTANVSEIFSPVALQMLAGKVAAVSGDVRRALDIGRRVVELAEHKKSKQVLQEITENSENKSEETVQEPKSVDLTQVVSVLNNVYGTSQNFQDDVNESVPLQQKLLLCSLILILKRSNNKDVTVGKLHEVYRKVCLKKNLLAVDQSEFVGLCSLIETRGIISIQGKKETRFKKVRLEWDEDEVSSVLRDKQLMSSILQDESIVIR